MSLVTIKHYLHREIYQIQIINGPVYRLGEENICRIVDDSSENEARYSLLDENDKVLISVENCPVVLRYKEISHE